MSAAEDSQGPSMGDGGPAPNDQVPGTAKELCALDHENPFQLLVATILSAQSTDVRVNMVTPALFDRYPRAPRTWPAADPAEVEALVASTGFFGAKTRSLLGMAAAVRWLATKARSRLPSRT